MRHRARLFAIQLNGRALSAVWRVPESVQVRLLDVDVAHLAGRIVLHRSLGHLLLVKDRCISTRLMKRPGSRRHRRDLVNIDLLSIWEADKCSRVAYASQFGIEHNVLTSTSVKP